MSQPPLNQSPSLGTPETLSDSSPSPSTSATISADRPLWKHQSQAINRAKELDQFALLFDPGLGKSRTTLELLRHRYNSEKRIMRTLIVAPVITLRNWQNEIKQYTKIPQDKVVVLEGTGKNREKLIGAYLMGQDPNKIAIVNYEGLAMMKNVRGLLKTWAPEIVIADEMHRMKNATAVRSKAVREVSHASKYRYGLTGTAILNSPMDIFGQWLWLDKGRTFGDSFFAFRGRFFEDKNARMPKHVHFPNWVPRASCVDQIKTLIQPMAASAIKSECLDLPPLIKKRVPVKLDKEQVRTYREMKEDFITWLGSDEARSPIVAQTALTKMLRLMQITSGYVKTEEGLEIPFAKNPKAEALSELLETILPHKVIIWAVFKQNYEIIRQVVAKHGVQMVECHGETPNVKKFDVVDRFTHDPNIKVFLGHPQSLGIGINLIAAPYSIYYSRNFSLENDIQSEARNHRAGSEIHESVTRYDLVVEGTVDELCLTQLEQKNEVSLSLVKNWVAIEEDLD
jgi:SWI/SNF-related matrix-associated actin-dependent regulator 1 of chromatin subfamily A